MKDATFFTHPVADWQRRYEALRASFVECLFDEGTEISVRTVERVLREEGFPKLPRRARLKMKMTVKGAHIPEKSKRITIQELEGQQLFSASAGLFLFAPFLAQLDLDPILLSSGLPGSQIIPATNSLLPFLALKLLGTERYAHVGDHTFDPGLGALAGLNVIPNCTALSTYSYSLDEVHILRLQEAFIKQGNRLSFS